MEITLGIILLIIIVIVCGYSIIAIRHASRFRYLSQRTVYVTIFFVIMSGLSIALILGLYAWVLLLPTSPT